MIMSMTKPGRTVVDVGANIGVYAYGFLERGANVVAIEPQAACADLITAFYESGFPRTARRGSLEVVIEALGNTRGTAVLHIPLKDGKPDDESASLDSGSPDSIDVDVKVRPLDDYGLDDVQIIKMDVEGHEVAAIDGAADTIRRWKPAILVEIEQRHHADPIADVFNRIHRAAGPGYQTWFLGRDGKLRPLDEFDVERHQLSLADNPLDSGYVRNFFILHGLENV